MDKREAVSIREKEALKPCPFCGGEATTQPTGDASGTIMGGCETPDCPMFENGFSGNYTSLAHFAEWWNTRAPTAVREACVGLTSTDRLRDALRECADKLWIARCDSRDAAFREAADKACDIADAALKGGPK